MAAGEGGRDTPKLTTYGGSNGQDPWPPRRTAHVRRRARARRSRPGGVRAAQAAAGATAAARARLYADLPARAGAAAGPEREDRPARPGADAGLRADLPAFGRGRPAAGERAAESEMRPHPDPVRAGGRHPGLRELLPTGAGATAAAGGARAGARGGAVHPVVHADPARVAG